MALPAVTLALKPGCGCHPTGVLCVTVQNPCFAILNADPFGGAGPTYGNVTVEVRDPDTAALVATGQTDATGTVCFTLDAGTYDIIAVAPTERWQDATSDGLVYAGGTASLTLVMQPNSGYVYAGFCDRPLPDALTLTTVLGTVAFGYDGSYGGWRVVLDVECDGLYRPNPYGGFCTQQRAATQVEVLLRACQGGAGITLRTPRAQCCYGGTLYEDDSVLPAGTYCQPTIGTAFPGRTYGGGGSLSSYAATVPYACDPFVAHVPYNAMTQFHGRCDATLWTDGATTLPYLTISG